MITGALQESSVDITLPDGTVDSFGYWANGFSGVIANYSDAGEYTVEKWIVTEMVVSA